MNQDAPEIKQGDQCCQDTNCCQTCSTPPKKDRRTIVLRILISLGVLMIAAGITAYVLINRNPGQAASAPAAKDTQKAAPAVGRSVISDLNWVKKAYQGTSGDSFTFTLLPGEEKMRNSIVSQQIEALALQMENQDQKIILLVLDRADPEFSTTVDRLIIRETPAVIGLNCSGNIAIINGEITPEKLFEAYYISTSTCLPGSAGSRCTGK